jgi:hypothetical protein
MDDPTTIQLNRKRNIRRNELCKETTIFDYAASDFALSPSTSSSPLPYEHFQNIQDHSFHFTQRRQQDSAGTFGKYE